MKIFEEAEKLYKDKKYEEATQIFYRLAEQGDNKALTYLGMIEIENGNLEKGSEYYLMAAKKGYSDAQNRIGVSYFRGRGIEKDIDKAIYWYQKAAEQNHIKAQKNLGLIYIYGNEIEKNINLGVYWLEKAAEQGDIETQLTLGSYFLNSVYVPKNLDKAIYWYEKAANLENIEGQYKLGEIYCFEENYIDYEKSIFWLKKVNDYFKIKDSYNYENNSDCSFYAYYLYSKISNIFVKRTIKSIEKKVDKILEKM